MIWIITANSNMCRFYHFDKHNVTIDLLKELSHPVNKLKKSEYLTSDKPGHYSTSGARGGAYAPHTDPKEAEIDSFAREIAHELNHGRSTNAYNHLIIISAPHMNGLISKHLDKHVKELVTKEIQKDVMPLAHHELLSFLEKNITHP